VNVAADESGCDDVERATLVVRMRREEGVGLADRGDRRVLDDDRAVGDDGLRVGDDGSCDQHVRPFLTADS